MKIAIIDADLIGRTKHRFPNLACEKISGYWKEKGADVELILDFNTIKYLCDDDQMMLDPWNESTDTNNFDHVYISKVFTDTPVPEWVQDNDVIHTGGTGFYFDKAPNLPDEIEHHMPDYSLYDHWLEKEIEKGRQIAVSNNKTFNLSRYMQQFKEYTDYSIGFLTRGCFRKCGFCVNKKYDHVFRASNLDEFYDPSRKKLCFLDDNFLGCPQWRPMLEEVLDTGRKFKFKQGLDERLLTDEKCKLLFNTNYDGDFTFAFDNIEDYDLIESKLKMIRNHTDSQYIKFYVLVGYKSTDVTDIENAFKRISLLLQYGCIPYIMRYQNKNDTPWKRSKWRGLYISIARWCNQPSIVKRMSFREFAERSQEYHRNENTLCAPLQALTDFEKEYPDIAKQYFDIKFHKF